MPFTTSFPFRRVSVNHAIEGITRVWWDLDPLFNDPGPYGFQLQVGNVGLSAAPDWEDVGDPVATWYAEDTVKRPATGKRLITHYRVVLTTPLGTFVSNPVGCYGDLNEEDWVFARELVRKELLRVRRKAGVAGVLFKRYRTGTACPRCIDGPSGQVTDSKCPACGGTRFKVGYYPPLPGQCWDLGGETINEKRTGTQVPGQSRNDVRRARIVAFPDLATEDVWADNGSGQRWIIQEPLTQIAVVRNVPVVVDATMVLAPYDHYVYRLQIGNEPNDNPKAIPPAAGEGCVRVTHDYGGQDNLAYMDASGCGITGAAVRAYRDYDTDDQVLVAETHTLGNGRWAEALMLNPGVYTLVFEKLGQFGPDIVSVTVAGAAPRSLSSSYSSSFGLVG